MQPSLNIIIPSWNGRKLLAQNLPAVLQALENTQSPQKRVTVIDDGSTDNSAALIKEQFPEIHLLINPKNRGFHYSINRGADESDADLILLLNSDMEPASLAFQFLYARFLKEPDLFAASGRIFASDKTTFLYGNRGGRFERGHFYLSEKPESATSQTLFACGGGGLFKRNQFLALGKFNYLFSPLYYEEQDISYRALKRGWKIAYEPGSVMYHAISVTIRKQISHKKIKLISARNNYLFVFKNITDPDYTRDAILFTPLLILSALLKGNPRFLIAFFMALPRLPRALFHRIKERKFYTRTDREIFEAVNKS